MAFIGLGIMIGCAILGVCIIDAADRLSRAIRECVPKKVEFSFPHTIRVVSAPCPEGCTIHAAHDHGGHPTPGPSL